MTKINNIFTKENHSHLSEEKTNEDPFKTFKIKRRQYLHIPEEKPPICGNLHREIEGQIINKSFKKKQALYHQIMVSNKQLDLILNEIAEKEAKKKQEKGVILNLNRKKIFNIIDVYTEVLKFKGVSENKVKKEDENITKKLLNKEEIDEMRKINHKLLSIVSNNQKKLYGKEKINQDKAKFLFEKSSFFTDLIVSLSAKKNRKKKTGFLNKISEKTEIFPLLKTTKGEFLKKNAENNEKNIKQRSISTHIHLKNKEINEEEKIGQEIEKAWLQMNENKFGSPNFIRICQKDLTNFDEFHKNSAWNSVLVSKEENSKKFFEQLPLKKLMKKRACSFSEKKPVAMKNENALEEITRIKESLKQEKEETRKIRKMLKRKRKGIFLSLNKLNKQMLHIS